MNPLRDIVGSDWNLIITLLLVEEIVVFNMKDMESLFSNARTEDSDNLKIRVKFSSDGSPSYISNKSHLKIDKL